MNTYYFQWKGISEIDTSTTLFMLQPLIHNPVLQNCRNVKEHWGRGSQIISTLRIKR